VKLLSIADLCARWTYTKAGIHKLVKTEKFPKPFAIVSKGKVKIFREEDIVMYEKNKPWLFNQEMKKRRQYLFLNSKNSSLEV
jgi:predicted DNA-binding transcriptional regulator AlpA